MIRTEIKIAQGSYELFEEVVVAQGHANGRTCLSLFVKALANDPGYADENQDLEKFLWSDAKRWVSLDVEDADWVTFKRWAGRFGNVPEVLGAFVNRVAADYGLEMADGPEEDEDAKVVERLSKVHPGGELHESPATLVVPERLKQPASVSARKGKRQRDKHPRFDPFWQTFDDDDHHFDDRRFSLDESRNNLKSLREIRASGNAIYVFAGPVLAAMLFVLVEISRGVLATFGAAPLVGILFQYAAGIDTGLALVGAATLGLGGYWFGWGSRTLAHTPAASSSTAAAGSR